MHLLSKFIWKTHQIFFATAEKLILLRLVSLLHWEIKDIFDNLSIC